jgi:SAM-dependent methyltransferase
MNRQPQETFEGAATSDKLKLHEILAGYYAAKMLDWLRSTGALAELASGKPVEEVARSRSLQANRLGHVLNFLKHVTAIVERDLDENCVLPEGLSIESLSHALDLYLGGFGPCVDNLPDIMAGRRDGAAFVNWSRHAAAFSAPTLDPILPRMLSNLGITRLLDVGCGSAQLLQYLSERDEKFRGVGIDSNIEVLDAARARLLSTGMNGDRIQLVACGVFDIADKIDKAILRDVDVVCLRSVANAFFCDDTNRHMLKLLSFLRSSFEGRLLVLADYYSKLSHDSVDARAYVRTLLHDIAQVLSSQGIPPASLQGWQAIYEEAGATLFKELHYSGGGVDHFIHLVQL